jgi:hypothetical protein
MKPLTAYGGRVRSRLHARRPEHWCRATDYTQLHDYRPLIDDHKRSLIAWTETCSRCRHCIVVRDESYDDGAPSGSFSASGFSGNSAPTPRSIWTFHTV